MQNSFVPARARQNPGQLVNQGKTTTEKLPTLDAAQLAALTSALPKSEFPAGMRIFDYGEPSDALYIVLKGEVECYHMTADGEKFLLEKVGPGRCFGEVSMFYGGLRTAAVRALDLTTLLKLERGQKEAFLKKHPDFADFLLTSMAQRLSRSGNTLRYELIRNANDEVAKQQTWKDRISMGATLFLSSYFFLMLFALLLAVWGWFYHWHGFDPNLLWLGLTLSILQIVIGNLVLNSQRRAGEQDKALNTTQYEANIHADKVVQNLNTKVEQQHAELLRRLDRIETQGHGKAP